MEGDEARERLDRLIRARRLTYAQVSRALGRNPAYIQQFIRRGVPRRLPEAERGTLARMLGVEEVELGGPQASTAEITAQIVRRIEGRPGQDTRGLPFDRQFLLSVSGGAPDDLCCFEVEGDAMVPTLRPGDQVLVRPLGKGQVHDGLHLLRLSGHHFVRRLAQNPVTGRIGILCDNPGYPAISDQKPERLDIVGRIVWLGRRID